MEDILFALWFFIPVGGANMAPVLINNISYFRKFNQPLDFGRSFRGKRIFGDHKTIRGMLAGVVYGSFMALLQMILFNNFAWARSISGSVDYSDPTVLLMGACLGLGALTGDAAKSFFKRQANVVSGRSWFPYDQIDFIIGGIIFSLPFVSLNWQMYLYILVVWFVLHPIANIVGWVLHLKSKPF